MPHPVLCIRIQVARPGHMLPGDMCLGVNAALVFNQTLVKTHSLNQPSPRQPRQSHCWYYIERCTKHTLNIHKHTHTHTHTNIVSCHHVTWQCWEGAPTSFIVPCMLRGLWSHIGRWRQPVDTVDCHQRTRTCSFHDVTWVLFNALVGGRRVNLTTIVCQSADRVDTEPL